MTKNDKDAIYKQRKSVFQTISPKIFKPYKKKRTCLNIGAWPKRYQIVKELKKAGWTVDLLEIWKEYCDFFVPKNLFAHIYNINVVDIDLLDTQQWDMVLWWHGPEHIEKVEFETVLPKLLDRAKQFLVLAAPYNGEVDNPEEHAETITSKWANNHHQLHRWNCTERDFKKFGMNTIITTPQLDWVSDEMQQRLKSQITAWIEKY